MTNVSGGTTEPAMTMSPVEDDDESVTTFQGTEIPVEVFEEASEPILDTDDPSAFEFDENVALSTEEAEERFIEIAESYEIGEPLSLVDLELVRAYATISDPEAEAAESASGASIVTASYNSARQDNIVLVGINPWTGNGSQAFSKTKTSQSVSAKLSGTLYVNTKISGLGNTWRVKSTGAITAGRGNVKKNSVSATFNAYGAVAAWPYVGLIYTKTASANNGVNNVSLDKSYSYNGLLAYWSATPSQSVNTKSGSFSFIP